MRWRKTALERILEFLEPEPVWFVAQLVILAITGFGIGLFLATIS